MSRPRSCRSAALLLVAAAVLAVSCATDGDKRRSEPSIPEARPTAVQRTGVPLLMDLPVIGVLFRKTTVVR